jgi:hypothetical protein
MEFSCAYFHHNRKVFYIIFAKKDDIIYINLMDKIRVVITIDTLMQDYLLRGYYFLSLCLTKNINDLINYEGTWGEQVMCNWCISSKVVWKLNRITNYFPNTAGFTSDPREWIFSLSSSKKVENFFSLLYDNDYYEHCPYQMIDYYISEEIHEIDDELNSIEEKTEKIDFIIKTVALMTSDKFKYCLPPDIMHLCF